MNPIAIANAISLVSSVISLATQAGEAWVALQPELEMLKQLAGGTALSDEQRATLMARHAVLTNAALADLGDAPAGAL